MEQSNHPKPQPQRGRALLWGIMAAGGIVVLALLAAWQWSRWHASKPDSIVAPEGGLNCVAFSPDSAGKYLAAGAASGNVFLWDTATRERLPVELPIHQPVTCLTISPDGWLAVGCIEQYVLAFEIRTHEVRVLPVFASVITSIQSRPRFYELAVGLADGELCIVDTKSTDIESYVSEHAGSVKAIAYNFDGTRLVTGGSDGRLIIRNAATRKVLRKIDAHTNEVSSVAFAPSGDAFVSASWDNTVKLWSLDDEQFTVTLPHPDAVSSVRFAQEYVVSGCWDGILRFWSTSDQTIVREFNTKVPIRALAVNPRGTDIVTVGQSKWLRFWKTPQP